MRNRHGITTTKRDIFFMSFKGDAKQSSLDQVTVPPTMGLVMGYGMRHAFGEWLKRAGRGWEFATDEQICRWVIDYWNKYLEPHDLPRRYDRQARRADLPEHLQDGGVRVRAPRS